MSGQEESITVVSGLPRSGTSMMMRMLAAGGVPVLVDGARPPDVDNPQGYFEFDPVKRLRTDAAWLDQAQGKAVKIVYKLLYNLPPSCRYRVLMMKRRLPEVVASQNAMLQRLGQNAGDSADDARMARLMNAELCEVLTWLRGRANFSLLELDYNRILADPWPTVRAIEAFLQRRLDPEAMCGCVEPPLYRQRRPDPATWTARLRSWIPRLRVK